MILTHRRIIAGWCFLTGALIAFLVLAYFYFDARYPRSARDIHLSSPSVLSHFKVEEAKKAGISEEEITEFLRKVNVEKFQVHMERVYLIEITVFVVAILAGSGLMILRPKKRHEE